MRSISSIGIGEEKWRFEDHKRKRRWTRFFERRTNLPSLYSGKEDKEQEEAIYHMLTWSQGSFTFKTQPIEMEDKLQTPTMYLLLEGVRRIDESESKILCPDWILNNFVLWRKIIWDFPKQKLFRN